MSVKKFSLAVLLVSVVIFGGCASTELIRPKQSDIDAYLLANPNLPAVDQSCIADGRFEIGMLAATVRFLLGEPKEIVQVRQPWAQQEHWKYPRGKTRIFIIEANHVVGIDERAKK